MNFVLLGFVLFSLKRAITSLNSFNQLNFVMVKCGVLFEVGHELLNSLEGLGLQRVKDG
jgi:hypothetical protein